MKVFIYGGSPYFVNLPFDREARHKNFELSHQNIDRLILANEDGRLRNFLLALLNLELSLVAHVSLCRNIFKSLEINYIFTCDLPNGMSIVLESKEGGKEHSSLRLFSENEEKNYDEQYWSNYFIDKLQKLRDESRKIRDYSSSVVEGLEKSGLPA